MKTGDDKVVLIIGIFNDNELRGQSMISIFGCGGKANSQTQSTRRGCSAIVKKIKIVQLEENHELSLTKHQKKQ